MVPLTDVIFPSPYTPPVDAVKFPPLDTMPHEAVIPPAKVPSPFASSLHVSVHVAPVKVPTLMVPADCISVETYKIPVLIESELIVPLAVIAPDVIAPDVTNELPVIAPIAVIAPDVSVPDVTNELAVIEPLAVIAPGVIAPDVIAPFTCNFDVGVDVPIPTILV